MDSNWQGCWGVNNASRSKLSRIGELSLQINDPKPDLPSSCGTTTMSSAGPDIMSFPQYMAAKNGEENRLRTLLQGVKDPDTKLLHVAAEQGHRNVVMYFAKDFPQKLNQKDDLYQTALHLAIRKNRVAIVQLLAKQPHIELDCRDGYHRTPLHIAASTGEMEMVKELCKQGINLDSRDLDDRTPLHYAASEGHLHVVSALTNDPRTGDSKAADPNAKDKHGCTPLHLAAYNIKALRAFKVLLKLPNICWDKQNDDGLTPLHFAAQAGNTEAVSQLQKLSLDAKNCISSVWRQTPLQIAAAAGHVQVIRAMRNSEERESNKLTTLAGWSDAIGRTALHYAALYGHYDVVEELLKNWGSPENDVLEKKDSGGFTALHLAAREGHEKVAQYLIAALANVNVKAGNSTIPEYLHSLALREHGVIGNLTSLDFVQSHGMSALHFAARGGHVLVVEELLKSHQRLETSAVDGAGLTPSDWAKVNGSLELFLAHAVNKKLSWRPSELSSSQYSYLQEKWEMEKQEALAHQSQVHKNTVFLQARLSCPTGDSAQSVIHWAASRGDVELLSHLLTLTQVDVNKQDIAGNTPAHLAARYGHVGALKVLLSDPRSVPNVKNHWKDTPLRLAFEGNHVEACRVILLLKCEVDENLGTLLREAIRKDMLEMCAMLVAQKGIRVTDQGRTEGKTPLQLAKETGSSHVEVLLRKKSVRRTLVEEWHGFQGTVNGILIAATLIAGITYQGWLQPPHGQNNSHFVFKRAALTSFWWLNSLSFYFAIATVLAGAAASLPTPRTQLTDSVVRARHAVAVACVLLTLATMSVMGAYGAAGLVVIGDSGAIVAPLIGGSLLCMGLLSWIARRLFCLYHVSTTWDFVNRDDEKPHTTARLLGFTPVSSGVPN